MPFTKNHCADLFATTPGSARNFSVASMGVASGGSGRLGPRSFPQDFVGVGLSDVQVTRDEFDLRLRRKAFRLSMLVA